MKSKTWTRIIALVLFAAPALPLVSSAQEQKAEHHHYKLVDLGSTFGGPQSYLVPGSGIDFSGSSVLNSAGRVVGYADTSEPDPFPNFCLWDCDVVHAFRTGSSGHLTDLGALPGGGSSVPMWISANGLIVGLSENGETDPLYAGLPQVHAVLWQQSKITDLGTLPEGGYQSVATAVNSSGQVVGAALNTIPDANSMQQVPAGPGAFWLWSGITPPYLYQMRALLWDKQYGMQDLGTLPGGSDAQAIMINESGQVIGFSYTASTQPGVCFALATSSFIWEKGKGMTDLGGFGGTCTLAAALNSKGQIVGESYRRGDQSAPAFLWERGEIHELEGSFGGDFTAAFALNDVGEAVGAGFLSGNSTFHAALWENAKSITDLGVVGSDQCSFAGAINANEQVVGSSFSNCNGDTGIVRAFLYHDGSLFDLNALIPSNSILSLQFAHAITDRGEIAGTGVDANGNAHAFLLIPCDENHPNIEGCDYSLADGNTKAIEASSGASTEKHSATKPTLQPDAIRRLLRSFGPRSSPFLSGIGAAATTAVLTPTSLRFACVNRLVGAGCTPPQNATLTNTGSSTLYLPKISIVGSLYFSHTTNCSSTLEAAHSCAITISFAAPDPRIPVLKKYAATLFVYDTTTASPQEVSLTGTTYGVP
jgi:probable HAF family extracellular repeat protein